MMAADWLQEQIRAFGRQLELTTFELNERGMAAVELENGLRFRLEYREPELWAEMLVEMSAGPEAAAALLTEAHPRLAVSAAGRVRTAYLERSSAALLAIRLEKDEIEVSRIDAAFRELFERASRLGRRS